MGSRVIQYASRPDGANPMITFIDSDILAWADTYHGPKFHALLCDPPYELAFMGKSWDASGVSFQPSTWAALAQHLLPGAFLMAFGGSRTYHRMACAIEDAGLVIHPAISWLYGSGFPKSTRIDTQIDKVKDWKKVELLSGEIRRAREEADLSLRDIGKAMQKYTNGQYGAWYHRGGHMFFETGRSLPSRPEWKYLRKVLPISDDFQTIYDEAERDIVETRKHSKPIFDIDNGGWNDPDRTQYDVTAPATPLARTWAGHRYGLQALKPAAEFICVAQVPYVGRPVECIVENGAGALAIDNARIPASGMEDHKTAGSGVLGQHGIYNSAKEEYNPNQVARAEQGFNPRYDPAGRWPANLVLDGEAARALDEMSGELHSPGNYKRKMATRNHVYGKGMGYQEPGTEKIEFDNGGGASRFFFTYPAEALDDAEPFYYCAKASRRERDGGLDGMSAREKYQNEGAHGRMEIFNGVTGDDEWRKKQPNNLVRNPHPTVKPIALARYLATLLLPPAEYAPRRLLVPFSGVGSEAIAAAMAGWDEVTGIEREAEYVEIANARAAYWMKEKAQMELNI